jgi:surfactin synthase thioesterase subunit
VVPVQLPGREGRFTEDPVTSASEMVSLLSDAVSAYADREFALFGHSMGAILAYEVACALADRGRPPTRLVVSGHVPAHLVHLKPNKTDVNRMSDEQLRGYLADNGGVDERVFDNPELMEILLPLLRADLTLCESYQWTSRSALTVPITALGGDVDPNTPAALLARWAELTTGGFGMALLPGGHHYLYRNVAAVTGLVADAMLGDRT